ncbi:uracil-DNA glycosylase [Raphidocelis subcapitata]|uniref:Uracil-DNA glycosylase n=1 Tax=Raphidocelis subcapitata TaxID=307507 RepID=A0A2V0NKC8_9CHLO|nr:uracil-DNA glycosylase [Raphidocelis subcapitata]|eukprot:GBF87761.1 uracil-DNA glycosylase [Raphidocelis subcapitata]
MKRSKLAQRAIGDFFPSAGGAKRAKGDDAQPTKENSAPQPAPAPAPSPPRPASPPGPVRRRSRSPVLRLQTRPPQPGSQSPPQQQQPQKQQLQQQQQPAPPAGPAPWDEASQPSGGAAAAGSSGGTTAAAAAAQPAAAPKPSGLDALMSSARRQAGAAKAGHPVALAPREMAAVAERNRAAVREALAESAREGRAPRLADLLVEPSWKEVLAPEFAKPYMPQLQAFLEREWASKTVYPAQESIFRAFNSVPFDQVRVVVLGQDPYFNPGEAMGLSFSVPPGVRVPSSLRNIYKELQTDLGCRVPGHGNLEKWCRQGVLLLNASLTVRAGEANSHAKAGWAGLTAAAVAALSKRRGGVVFLLWGKFAHDRGQVVDTTRHHVLKSAHPSGLSASRGFFGCRHFSQANALLAKEGLPPIDWQIE